MANNKVRVLTFSGANLGVPPTEIKIGENVRTLFYWATEMKELTGDFVYWYDPNEKLPMTVTEMTEYFITMPVILTDGNAVWCGEYKCGNTIEFWYDFGSRPFKYWARLPKPPEELYE